MFEPNVADKYTPKQYYTNRLHRNISKLNLPTVCYLLRMSILKCIKILFSQEHLINNC